MIEPVNLPSLEDTVDPSRWDRFGVVLSALCMVHCLGLPALAILLPALALPSSHAFHVGLLAFVAPIALIALAAGFRRHRAWAPVTAGAFGLCLLILAVAPGLPETAEKGLTVAGGVVLVVAHLANTRLARCGGGSGFNPFGRHAACLAERTAD